ncbi:MAG: uroporphyrinogen-III C-methyltransferase [Zavarzinia sp.]|nr:uroporphyrinogen-III C-methyltransferase [Zavarzinia sp.]
MTGFVSFVSAGPGDPELLTLKAVDRLGRADAVLYDDLSAGPILDHARPGADLVGVGKRAGRASPRQDHISRLLVDYAAAGLRVVRLKSGDAGIFGRLEEEIEALRAAAIPFEIVPGVPSPCAAAAGALMPLTRRLAARRLQFVTGHDVAGQLPEDLDMAALADPGAVTAVFMGRRTFPAMAAALMVAGLPGETPALMVEDASLSGEKHTRSTVAGLARLLAAQAAGPAAPALILYGPLILQGDGAEGTEHG